MHPRFHSKPQVPSNAKCHRYTGLAALAALFLRKVSPLRTAVRLSLTIELACDKEFGFVGHSRIGRQLAAATTPAKSHQEKSKSMSAAARQNLGVTLRMPCRMRCYRRSSTSPRSTAGARLSLWVMAILINSVRMQLRRRPRCHIVSLDLTPEDGQWAISGLIADPRPTPEQTLEQCELRDLVTKLTGSLPPSQGTALRLRQTRRIVQEWRHRRWACPKEL
jgi:hypothetical protein